MEDLIQKAIDLVRTENNASVSFVQRKLMIGYNRAWDIIEILEQRGVISQPNHIGKRYVIESPTDEQA